MFKNNFICTFAVSVVDESFSRERFRSHPVYAFKVNKQNAPCLNHHNMRLSDILVHN